MWGVFKSVSQTFNTYVWGTEQPPQVPKEPESTLQPAPPPRKSSKGPVMHNVPEKIEEDYRTLISAKQLSQGFMIMPVRKDDAHMGKIIFSLGDFLTVAKSVDFVSDKGTIIVRSSDTEITVGDVKKISISQENVKEKLVHLSKLREQSTDNLRDLMEHQPSVQVEDPLGAILVSVSEDDKKEDEKAQEAKKIEDEKKKAEEKKRAEEEEKRKQEETKKKEAEEQRLREEKKKAEDAERKKKEEEAKKQEELKIKEAAEKKKEEEEEAKKKQEEQKLKEAAEKKKREEEEEAKKKQEEQKIKEAAEKKKREEEEAKKKEEEKKAAENKRKEEEAVQRKKQEAEQQVNEEKKQPSQTEVKVEVSQEESAEAKKKQEEKLRKEEEQERRRKENQEKLEQERKEEEERRRVMEEQRKKAEEDRAQKKESPAATQKKLKTGEGCEVCGKRVYPMERFSIGEKAYHQNCFKCAHCNRPLTLGSYSAVDQSLYCKPHFLQLFKEKGTYSTLQGSNNPQMTSKDAESVETKPIVKYATVSTSTVSKELLNELKEDDSAPSASQGTIRRAKAASGRRLPTKKDRSSLTMEKKKEAPIYVIDEATLAAMEEPKELAPLDRPKKINLQDNYDDLPTDPKLRRAEQERRLQEEEDRMRDEKERRRREESQAAFQQMLSPAIKRKGEVIYAKTLIHIKGKRRVRVRRVQLSSTSLNSGDVFVLDCGKKIYVWNGSEANRMEKAKGLDVSQRMSKSTGAKIIVVAEKEENKDLNEFYEEIGGAGEIASAKSAGDDEEYEKEISKKYQLYKIFNGQPMLVDEKLLKKVLDTEHTYVLDCETEIYCWIGKKSPKEDRRDAMEISQQLLQDNPRPEWVYKDVEVKRVVEAGEPILFREKFGDWPDSLPIASQDVSANSNIAVVQKIEKYDVNKIFEMQRKPEEMVDEGGGDKEVWVVNGNTKEVYTDLGCFYSKRCYIILYKYNYRTGPTGNYVKYVLYYWQGVDSPKNDRGASGLLATDIYKDINKNGGEVVMIRVLQNKENQHFKLSYKGKMVTRKGDAPAAVTLFKIREPESESYINAIEVPKASSALCSRHIFALQTESNVYLWLGKGSTSLERENSEKFVSLLCENRTLHIVMETEEPEAFWEALGTTDKFYANASYLSTFNWKPRLFCASEGTGVYDIDEVYHFNQEDLVQKYAFILDAYYEVYVWCGHYSSELVKKMTMETALEYVTACVSRDGRPSDVPVFLLYSGEEPINFTCQFQTWFPAVENKEPASVLVADALKDYDKLYTLEELTTACPKFLDKTKLEKYLTDEEFEKTFSMNKETFATIPLWKAQEIKKKIGLY